jgi:hypothetical protein
MVFYSGDDTPWRLVFLPVTSAAAPGAVEERLYLTTTSAARGRGWAHELELRMNVFACLRNKPVVAFLPQNPTRGHEQMFLTEQTTGRLQVKAKL